jgi:hypothetical protein
MKNKVYLFAFLFYLSLGISFAQINVSGNVVDERGEPVIGASILLKGSKTGVLSDIDVNFII